MILSVCIVQTAPNPLVLCAGIVNGQANALAWTVVLVDARLVVAALIFLASPQRRA